MSKCMQGDTESGDYTSSTSYWSNAAGCDSVVTLHLTINQPVTAETTIETPDSCYTWNGQTYCASGDYVQTLTATNGCDSIVTLHLTTSVGVADYELTTVLCLAPNPAKNVCRVVGLNTPSCDVEVYDMRGRLLLRRSGTEFDVSTLATGVYIVKVYDGKHVTNLKLIKQ